MTALNVSAVHGGLSGARVSRQRPAAAFVASSARHAPRLHSRRSAAPTVCVLDVTEDNFDAEVLKSDLPVLVDFWATWCGPCKLVAPSMTWAEKEYDGVLKVVKVNADPCPALMEKYKVYGLPCLLLIRGGEEVEGSHREGAITKKGLAEYLEKNGIAPVAA